MSTPESMFVLDGNERGHDDYGALYETDIEPDLTENPGPHLRPIEVEEWSIRTGRDLLPDAASVVERLAEQVWDDAGEFAEDFIADTDGDPELLEAAEALCVAMGKRATFYLAHRKVATHTISWDEAGEPLWNGERMYRKRADAQV